MSEGLLFVIYLVLVVAFGLSPLNHHKGWDEP